MLCIFNTRRLNFILYFKCLLRLHFVPDLKEEEKNFSRFHAIHFKTHQFIWHFLLVFIFGRYCMWKTLSQCIVHNANVLLVFAVLDRPELILWLIISLLLPPSVNCHVFIFISPSLSVCPLQNSFSVSAIWLQGEAGRWFVVFIILAQLFRFDFVFISIFNFFSFFFLFFVPLSCSFLFFGGQVKLSEKVLRFGKIHSIYSSLFAFPERFCIDPIERTYAANFFFLLFFRLFLWCHLNWTKKVIWARSKNRITKQNTKLKIGNCIEIIKWSSSFKMHLVDIKGINSSYEGVFSKNISAKNVITIWLASNWMLKMNGYDNCEWI